MKAVKTARRVPSHLSQNQLEDEGQNNRRKCINKVMSVIMS